MRKAINVMLGAVLAVALSSGAQAAGKAGIGLEWSWVPTVPLGGFDIELSGQEFTLAWEISDRFTVGVFRGDGQAKATHEYTDNVTSAPTDITRKMSVTAPVATSGIRLMTNLPVMNDMISAGIEMGAVTFGNASERYSSSSGIAVADTDFGSPVYDAMDGQTLPLIGLMGKIRLIEAKASSVTTALTVSGAVRFVPFDAEEPLVGTQEVINTAVPPTGIDPIGNYTNIAIAVALGLWF